jgi:hypothetical protein
MVDRVDPTGGALELATSTAPPPAQRRTAWPPSPDPPARWLSCCWWRSWAARGRGRRRSVWHESLARWLASRRPPASAGVEVTTGRVTVVKDAGTSVLVHRVETALVVRTQEWPQLARRRSASRGQQGTTAVNEPPARQPLLTGRRTSGHRSESSLKAPVSRQAAGRRGSAPGAKPRGSPPPSEAPWSTAS